MFSVFLCVAWRRGPLKLMANDGALRGRVGEDGACCLKFHCVGSVFFKNEVITKLIHALTRYIIRS